MNKGRTIVTKVSGVGDFRPAWILILAGQNRKINVNEKIKFDFLRII